MGSHAEHGNQHTKDTEAGLKASIFSLLCHAKQGSLSKTKTASEYQESGFSTHLFEDLIQLIF